MSLPAARPVTCPFCGCFCNDLQIAEDGQGRLAIHPRCPKAEAGFAEDESAARAPTLEGQETGWDQAIEAASTLIRGAHKPLVLLSGGASCQAQAAGARLGRELHAYLDTPASACDSAWTWAVAEGGLSTCTLGELAGVQLVFWGADASSTHPRLQSRYAAESTVRAISVDCQPGRDIDLIRSQRRALKGKPCEKSAHLLLQTFQEAKGGIILAGSGLARQGRAALQELCCLCADLEDGGWGRWEILPLLEGTNSLGAIQALMAVCGFPGSACFTPNRAEFSPLDWSAEHVLLHHWTDLLIWVGAESWLSPTALSKMDAIPNIVVSSRPPDWSPTAWLPVRQFGIDAEGTALRLDGAPVNFTPAFERPGWDMPAVLERLGAP